MNVRTAGLNDGNRQLDVRQSRSNECSRRVDFRHKLWSLPFSHLRSGYKATFFIRRASAKGPVAPARSGDHGQTYLGDVKALRTAGGTPWRSHWWRVIGTSACAALLMLTPVMDVSSSASATGSDNPYSIGSPIGALKITRLQMLTSALGVGVAPITTYSGGLVRAYLARTDNAGKSWSVTGTFPKGFYPWTTAFTSPKVGYVIDGVEAIFTSNAGRTWSSVKTTGGPLSISVKGDVIWIPVENCVVSAMQGPCSTHLDSYLAGDLAPLSVTSLRSDQPILAHVGPTSGYAIGSSGVSGRVFFTSNSGATWRAVANPCQDHQVTSGAVASLEHLVIFCDMGPGNGSGPIVLFRSNDGGATWSKVIYVPDVGAGADVGYAGRFLWVLTPTLWESSDGGRDWSPVMNVNYGPSGDISTFGTSEAWHPVPGQGIFRTLNGKMWRLLR